MLKPRVLAVAQAFKDGLSLPAVAAAFEEGIHRAGCQADVLAGSDGGDGLLDALLPQLVGTSRLRVTGPLGTPVEASVGWLDRRSAVVESRLVCGLGLVPQDQRNPRRTTTYGLGELVAGVVAEGAEQICIGLGGSATMDGGMGMATAWGWVPRDAAGRRLGRGGGALSRLASIDRGTQPRAHLVGLIDVTNALLGPNGAQVYAAQKGADAKSRAILVRGLERLVEATASLGGPGLARREGAGAAGGLGFGILCFGAGELSRGAAWVLERVGFDGRLKGADLVLTGEGVFDATSSQGKLTGEVLRRAGAAGVPAALVAPRCDVPVPDVVVETGGGWWDPGTITARVEAAVRRALRLSP